MDPQTFSIKDPLEIHSFFRAYPNKHPTGWWYRGHANKAWQLIPRAGRPEFFLPDVGRERGLVNRDLGRFNAWRRSAIAYLDTTPANDWEALAVAQHHGLVTRLLDWSFNPLVAMFFACCEQKDVDGCVYCYEPPGFVNKEVLKLDSDTIGTAYIPRALSPRILNQRGAFTVHGPPTQPIVAEPHPYLENCTTLVRLEIPASLKWDILLHLDQYGINRATLFPDIDGLCAHINFETEEILQMHARSRTGKSKLT